MCEILYQLSIKLQAILAQDVRRWVEYYDYFVFEEFRHANSTSYFKMPSTATTKYWFPAFVRGNGPAKSIRHVWNIPLIGIFPINFYRFSGFAFWQVPDLFSKLATDCRKPRHQKWSLTNDYVELMYQCPTSSCKHFNMLPRISMCGINRIPWYVRRNLSSWTR